MHYHLEVITPPGFDPVQASELLLKDFDENAEERYHAFWDWYVVGGRYSGAHMEAHLDPERIKEFENKLSEMGVTVAGLRWGKQELKPESQIETVDALWREMFPHSGSDKCLLFKHAGDRFLTDTCSVLEIAENLTAYHVLIGAVSSVDFLRPESMYLKSIYTGCNFVDTTWSGNVLEAIEEHNKKLETYADWFYEKNKVTKDWRATTIDYHS